MRPCHFRTKITSLPPLCKGMNENSMPKKFVVVEFQEEDPPAVAVVNSAWLHDFSGPDRCKAYWPPTRSTDKLNRLIMASTPADPDTWTSWVVRILYSSDDHDKAKKRCEKATEETDVDYVSEPATGKRDKRPNRKYIPIDSSSSSSEEEVRTSPKSPKKRKQKSKSHTQHYAQAPDISLSPRPSSAASRSTPATSGSGSAASRSSPASSITSPAASKSSPTTSRPSSVATTGHFAGHQELRRLHIKMEEVKSEVRENRKLLGAILAKMEKGRVGEIADIPEGIPSLPLNNIEDFSEVNTILQEDLAKKKQFVSYLKRCGGATIKESVRRVLDTMMDPRLSVQFNWMGQRGKKHKFSGYKAVTDVIFEAVRGNERTRSASLDEVESGIQYYLKYIYQKVPKNDPELQRPVTPEQQEEEAALPMDTEENSDNLQRAGVTTGNN